MTRKEAISCIKIMSYWKVDRRRRDYELPSGVKLSSYLIEHIERWFSNNKFCICEDGSIRSCFVAEDKDGIKRIHVFSSDEKIEIMEQGEREVKLLNEILGTNMRY